MTEGFDLAPQIAADSHAVVDWELCQIRLMDDARFPWLLLLPRRVGLVEWTELDPDELGLLALEIKRAGEGLRAVMPFDKLNVGALGNIVRQMHVHVIGRRIDDSAWPGAVWGQGVRQAYDPATLARLLSDLRKIF